MNQTLKHNNGPTPANPKLSIICVAYNPGLRAKTTLDSIAKLSYSNFEVILIDNCSDSESLKIYEQYKSLINVYLSEPDAGIYDAMNKGIERACGDWIWFMNMGDSFAEANIVEKIFAKVKDVKIKVIVGDTLVENGSLKFIKRFYPSIEKNFQFGILHLNHQSVLVHHEVFKQVGKFEANKYPIRADMHHLTKTYFRYHANAFFHVEQVLAVYQEDGVSSHTANLLRMYDEDIKMQVEFYTAYQIPALWLKKWYSYLKVKGLKKMQTNAQLYKLYRRFKYYFKTQIEEQV